MIIKLFNAINKKCPLSLFKTSIGIYNWQFQRCYYFIITNSCKTALSGRKNYNMLPFSRNNKKIFIKKTMEVSDGKFPYTHTSPVFFFFMTQFAFHFINNNFIIFILKNIQKEGTHFSSLHW